jgi:glycosyltransferase involved in cell wall biosynthesis
VKSEKLDNVEFLGYRSGDNLKNEVRNSMALVIPSELYENNPRSVIEAFALGKPAIGARIGGIPELVKDGRTGYTYTPGDAEDLRDKIECLLKNPDSAIEMGKNARRFVEENFNPEKHYQELMKIYQMAMNKHA